jgi:hypothetical protein
LRQVLPGLAYFDAMKAAGRRLLSLATQTVHIQARPMFPHFVPHIYLQPHSHAWRRDGEGASSSKHNYAHGRVHGYVYQGQNMSRQVPSTR